MTSIIKKPTLREVLELLNEFGGRSAVDDPIKVFRFIVEVDGFARAGFLECNGLEQTTEVVEYREGGNNATPQKSAGLTTFANVTLRRGQFIGSTDGGEDDFSAWAQDVYEVNANGAPLEYRRTLDIVQYHRSGVEAVRHRVYEGWPTRFKPFGDLNGTANENSIQELEITHEGFDKLGQSGASATVGASVGGG